MILPQEIIQLSKLELFLPHAFQHSQVLHILQSLQDLPAFINIQNDLAGLLARRIISGAFLLLLLLIPPPPILDHMIGIDEVLSGFLNCLALRERTRHILHPGHLQLAVLYKIGLNFHWVTPLCMSRNLPCHHTSTLLGRKERPTGGATGIVLRIRGGHRTIGVRP